MRLHYPLNLQGAEDAGQLPWTDGVPSTGVEGSYFGNKLFTDTEAEILAAIDASGQTRNGSDLTQLVQAVARGIYVGQFTGTPNALACALPNNVVFASLQRGTRLTGFVTSTNATVSGSAGVTVALTGIGPLTAPGTVTAPLLRKNGTALLAADLPVNQDFEIRWDGNAFRMAGAVVSDGVSAAAALAIAQAAGSLFNFKTLTSTTRTNASAQSAGLQVPVLSGLAYTKKSPTSTLVIVANFLSYAPVVPGQGNGASGVRLSTSTGATADVALNNVYNTSNGAPGGSGSNSPTFVLPGIPAGALTFGLSYSRGDALAWNSIFNPYPSDFGTTGPTPSWLFFIYEFEPSA